MTAAQLAADRPNSRLARNHSGTTATAAAAGRHDLPGQHHVEPRPRPQQQPDQERIQRVEHGPEQAGDVAVGPLPRPSTGRPTPSRPGTGVRTQPSSRIAAAKTSSSQGARRIEGRSEQACRRGSTAVWVILRRHGPSRSAVHDRHRRRLGQRQDDADARPGAGARRTALLAARPRLLLPRPVAPAARAARAHQLRPPARAGERAADRAPARAARRRERVQAELRLRHAHAPRATPRRSSRGRW